MAVVRRYGKLMGVIVSVLILAVIYVPFQQATAFTVSIDLPDDDDDTILQSAAGENFEIVIDVEASELISIEDITLILDNGEPSVAQAIFDSDGNRITGSTDLVVNNELTISAFSDTGYAYGFGLVSNGVTGPSGYAYSIPSSYGFIAGNNIGFTTVVGDPVTGLIGPGEITISGKLRTAELADGAHTLDVSINTGAGIDPDELTTNTFNFTVEEDDSVIVEEVSVPDDSTEVQIDTVDSEGQPVNIELSLGNSTTTTGDVTVTIQRQ